MKSPAVSRVPEVLDGLEPLVAPIKPLPSAIAGWMRLVTPRAEWDTAEVAPSGQPAWWSKFREDVRKAYRDGVNRCTRLAIKTQAEAELEGLGITRKWLCERALVTETTYYHAFDDFGRQGEAVINTIRAFMGSREKSLRDPRFETFRGDGVSRAMRYVRYRYFSQDKWYSNHHLERGRAARRKSADDDEEEEGGSRRYLPDWSSTIPPHPLVLQALRRAFLRKHGLRPASPIDEEAAARVRKDIEAALSTIKSEERPDWCMTPSSVAEELNVWRPAFALTVLCVDPDRLTNKVQ